MDGDPDTAVDLDTGEKHDLVEKKATCPFVGSVIAEGKLAVRNSAGDPLARIEDIRALGNSGGGDLGDLLALFAAGNHAFLRGPSGKLDQHVPDGLFSLEFPGSQGSHPGHSGILQGDPDIPGSGRLNVAHFARLVRRARDGWIKRSDVGAFIAENLHKDPRSKVFGATAAALLACDLAAFVKTIGPAIMQRLLGPDKDTPAAHRELEEKLTKLLGEDNLVGSAGEYGLLFALLANKPGARDVDGEPAVSVLDLEAMFLENHLPGGWETWKKSRLDWVKNTMGLLLSASKAYRVLNQEQDLRSNMRE